MGIILLKMPQWLISVFNWFTIFYEKDNYYPNAHSYYNYYV